MFCEAWPDLKYLIFTSHVPDLLYYSHMPSIVISLLIGLFVYFKSKLLTGKILLAISSVFSLWAILNLIVWVSPDSRLLMFIWSFFGLLYALIYILSLYFVYVFIEKKDISIKIKAILGILLLPVIFFSSTGYNLSGFDLVNCEAQEGIYFTNYYYFLGLLISFWILVYSIVRYMKAEADFKKQILFLTIGIEAFLFSFFTSGFLASYLVEKEVIVDFGLEQYGLFGMTIFMGFLAYLIVRFKAFNIKLMAVQALVFALVILIGSQFFFIRNFTNKVLTAITFILASGFGWVLIRSVQLEMERKEELPNMSNRLSEANDRLRKLDNAKSEFISIASHQLRTPLTSIKGYASLLLEGTYGTLTDKLREALNKIYLSNERLIALVEDLLNLSRIEAGRMEYKYEKFKIEDLCQEIFDTFVIRAKEKKLGLDFKYPPNPVPEVINDRNKLREVISNLVDNALKYTPSGGVKLNLSQNGENIRVAVSDTGVGILPEELPHLFEKFTRGKEGTKVNTGGTGLGLHVGKRMIEALHGKIWAESEGAGKGSTFIIEIPLAAGKEGIQTS